jgi:DHA1 family multidrug resistance protein-like MFS transporter
MQNKKSLIIIFAGIFWVMVGFGITLPVLPFYIQKLLLSKSISANKIILHASLITGMFSLAQFLFSPFLGSLSDKVGRRSLILCGLGGYSLATLLFVFANNVFILYLSRLIAGFFAAAVIIGSSAYIADDTSKEERGRGMAVLGSMAALGIAMGPIFGNLFTSNAWGLKIYLLQVTFDKFNLPFIISSVLTLIIFSLLFFLLPESSGILNHKDLKSAVYIRKSFNESLKSFSRTFVLILALSFISQLSLSMFEGTFALHSQRLFSFGPSQMSIVFIVCGFLMAMLQLGPVKWLMERKGESRLLPFGFFVLCVGILLIITSRRIELIILYVSFISIGMSILTPSLSSLITKTQEKGHGITLGIFSSVNSLGQVVGVTMGGVLMMWFVHFPYILVSLILLITTLFLLSKSGSFLKNL